MYIRNRDGVLIIKEYYTNHQYERTLYFLLSYLLLNVFINKGHIIMIMWLIQKRYQFVLNFIHVNSHSLQ